MSVENHRRPLVERLRQPYSKITDAGFVLDELLAREAMLEAADMIEQMRAVVCAVTHGDGSFRELTEDIPRKSLT